MAVQIGEKFAKLTVIKKAKRDMETGCRRWWVRCECGREKVVLQKSLKQGHTGSCAQVGCKMSWNRKEDEVATANGKTQRLVVWARELGISPQTLRARWMKGLRGEVLLAAVRPWRGPRTK